MAVVLAEQVPEQYQLTGVDIRSVLQCSVTDVPSNADELRGVTTSAASPCVNSWLTSRIRKMLPGMH